MNSFICSGCDKDFYQKIHLANHEKICEYCTPKVRELLKRIELLENEKKQLILEKEILIHEKKEIINMYADLTHTLAKNPRNTTTNNIHNTLNLSVFNKTATDIKKIVEENYDKEYLIQGQKGVARFTHSHVLKTEEKQLPIYTITDKTRGNGKYRSSETEVVTDPCMFGLTKKIYPNIKIKAINIGLAEGIMKNQEMFGGYQEVFNMIDDNTVFREEMVRLVAYIRIFQKILY